MSYLSIPLNNPLVCVKFLQSHRTTGVELLDMHLEKLMVYFAMVFAIVLELVQMRFNANLARYRATLGSEGADAPSEKADQE